MLTSVGRVRTFNANLFHANYLNGLESVSLPGEVSCGFSRSSKQMLGECTTVGHDRFLSHIFQSFRQYITYTPIHKGKFIPVTGYEGL
jgi:hypothetical protein